MQSHLCLDDDMFALQFAECTLDPKFFTHEAHLRLAWIHVMRYGVAQAQVNLRGQISRYDRVLGDGTKYHETVTMAAIHVVDHFIRKSRSVVFQEFIDEFPGLRTGFMDLLHQHYSAGTLKDPSAKHVYLRPDLRPF